MQLSLKFGSIWHKIEENHAGKTSKNRLFMGFLEAEICNNFTRC